MTQLAPEVMGTGRPGKGKTARVVARVILGLAVVVAFATPMVDYFIDGQPYVIKSALSPFYFGWGMAGELLWATESAVLNYSIGVIVLIATAYLMIKPRPALNILMTLLLLFGSYMCWYISGFCG